MNKQKRGKTPVKRAIIEVLSRSTTAHCTSRMTQKLRKKFGAINDAYVFAMLVELEQEGVLTVELVRLSECEEDHFFRLKDAQQ